MSFELKNELPQFEIKLPSSGESITLRPYTVKEENILLMAVESGDQDTAINSTKQVIKNCLVEPKDLNIESLPYFDIDYMFLTLRARSVGESVTATFVCPTIVDNHPCNTNLPVEINIDNIKMDETNISREFKIGPSTTIHLDYPTYTSMKKLDDKEGTLKKKIKLIASCVTKIVDKKKVWTKKDFTPSEIVDYLDGLTREQFSKLEEFIDNLPGFYLGVKTTCPKCNTEHDIKYNNLVDFFLS